MKYAFQVSFQISSWSCLPFVSPEAIGSSFLENVVNADISLLFFYLFLPVLIVFVWIAVLLKIATLSLETER